MFHEFMLDASHTIPSMMHVQLIVTLQKPLLVMKRRFYRICKAWAYRILDTPFFRSFHRRHVLPSMAT